MMEDKRLVEEASEALRNAYAPYSGIKVGASVAADSGEVYSGCNVENASYGLTMCAERAAMFAAVAGGHRKLRTLAVVADGMDCPLPCGACLQVMSEFGLERVIIGTLGGKTTTYDLGDLLPRPFRL
jgi:cytidine deaminase